MIIPMPLARVTEVGQPESHPLPLQLHAIEHDTCTITLIAMASKSSSSIL